jgi:hypothetical protein
MSLFNRIAKSKLFTFAIVAASFGISKVSSAANISVFGNFNYLLLSITTPVEIKGDYGFGGGAMIGFPLSATSEFEVGGAYNIGGMKVLGVRQTSKFVAIPANLLFGSGSMSFSVGGYYNVTLESTGENDYGAAVGMRFKSGALYFKPEFLYGFKKVLDKAPMLLQVSVGYSFGGK